MSFLPSNDLALEWSRDSSLGSPLYWGLGSFQSGTLCAGTFSHQEPQVTFLPSSYSKAGGFGCRISVFSQEGMFCGGDLPVSGLGYPRVSGLASSKEPARCCLLWKRSVASLAAISAGLCCWWEICLFPQSLEQVSLGRGLIRTAVFRDIVTSFGWKTRAQLQQGFTAHCQFLSCPRTSEWPTIN